MADTIKVTLTPTTLNIAPSGAPVEAVVSIQNTGPTVEQYRLELEGLPDGWYTLPNTSTALFPNDRDEAKVTIRPPEGVQAAAGTYPFTLSVVSIANPTEKTSVTGTVQVVATAATATLDAELRPSRVTGRKARYRILLRNGGNAPLDLDFEAHDSEEGCDFVFKPPTATLKAGKKATVTMRTRSLRTRLVGQEHPYDFQVLVKPSGADPRPLQGQFIYKPRFRSWRPFLRFVTFAVLIGALVIAALIVVPMILNAPQVNAQPNVSIGNAKLGATGSKAVAQSLGKGARTSDHGTVISAPQKVGSLTARLHHGQVVALETTSPAYNVAKGVHVGSTVADVQKAFGNKLQVIGVAPVASSGSAGGNGSSGNSSGGAGGKRNKGGSGHSGTSGSTGSTGSGSGVDAGGSKLAGGSLVLVGTKTLDGQRARTYFDLDKAGRYITSIRMGFFPWITPDHGGPTVVTAITQTTTWGLDGAPYLVQGDVRIPTNVVLTIRPGVHVYFADTNSSLNADGGSLHAIGTADAPIVFTALNDQRHGAYDTVQRPPAKAGDWGDVGILSGGGALTLDYCDVYYAGSNPYFYYDTYNTAIGVSGEGNPTVSIQHSEIAYSQGWGFDARSAPVDTTIHDDVFYGNTYPLRLAAGMSLDDSNRFEQGGTRNRQDGIFVPDGVTLAQDGEKVSWAATRVPFVLSGSATVGSNGVLRLGPGVTIKGAVTSSQLDVDGGTLDASGTGDRPVVLTSFADDTHGGDTNGNGSNSSPKPGDWTGIRVIGSNSTLALDHADVYYAGANYYDQAGVSIDNGDNQTISIRHGTFAYNKGWGIDAADTPSATIASDTFYGNDAPLQISAGLNLDDSNSFQGAQPNKKNAIFLAGDTSLNDGSWTLGVTRAPILMDGLSVEQGAKLTIGPGVTIKGSSSSSQITIDDGDLTIEGTGSKPVVMTSYSDDAHGGDSNGDGSSSSPQAGDWRGLVINGAAHVHISNLKVLYAGSDGYPSLSIDNSATGGVAASEVAQGAGDGLYNGSDHKVTISGSSIHDNAGWGINFGYGAGNPDARSTTTLSGNSLSHNAKGGIAVDDATPPTPEPSTPTATTSASASTSPTPATSTSTPASGDQTPAATDTPTSSADTTPAATEAPEASATSTPGETPVVMATKPPVMATKQPTSTPAPATATPEDTPTPAATDTPTPAADATATPTPSGG